MRHIPDTDWNCQQQLLVIIDIKVPYYECFETSLDPHFATLWNNSISTLCFLFQLFQQNSFLRPPSIMYTVEHFCTISVAHFSYGCSNKIHFHLMWSSVMMEHASLPHDSLYRLLTSLTQMERRRWFVLWGTFVTSHLWMSVFFIHILSSLIR